MTSQMASSWRAWVLLALLLLAYISSIVDRVVISFVVQPMKLAFGVNDTAISYLGGIAFTLFYAILGVPIARYADRLNPLGKSRQILIASGVGVWSIATVLCGFTTSYNSMFAARVGVAVGEAVLGPVAYALLASNFTERQRGLALSIYGLGIPFGQGIAFWIAGKAVQYASGFAQLPLSNIMGDFFSSSIGAMTIPGWQIIFLVVGMPGLLVAFALALLPARYSSAAFEERHHAEQRTLGEYLRNNIAAILWHCVGFGVFAMYYQGCGFWFVEHFVRSYGWNKADIGAAYGICAAVFGTGGLIIAGMTSRVEHGDVQHGDVQHDVRNTLHRKYHLLRIGSVMLCFVGVFMPLMPTGIGSVIVLGMVCFVGLAPYGIAAAVIQDTTPVYLRAQMGGVYLLVLNVIAGVCGPVVVSWITEYAFGYSGALRYSISIIGGVCGIVSWWMFGRAQAEYDKIV